MKKKRICSFLIEKSLFDKHLHSLYSDFDKYKAPDTMSSRVTETIFEIKIYLSDFSTVLKGFP